MMRRGSVKLSRLRERFAVIAEDASAEVVRRHARAYLLHLLGCTIFSDKTGNSVPLMYLPLLEDFDRASRYSWGGATLAYLYRQLSIACKSDANAICGSLTLLQVQQTDSSTSDAGPSEPCTGMPQQPDDGGPPQFSPDVMTVSQYDLVDVGASQILTDEGMPDTQPPQSTIGTYRRQ
ncbi:hypothetical protein Taro_011040 [Colocasia esculenta]|uniref:Aminotransferase-like plant mobile domain-containing protein n=1 Tax=Colocasia esculenta TaxID=4460 RepID=A0A843UEY3_COLES|nr:hypothetical protein [Colocasia esculenta]